MPEEGGGAKDTVSRFLKVNEWSFIDEQIKVSKEKSNYQFLARLARYFRLIAI